MVIGDDRSNRSARIAGRGLHGRPRRVRILTSDHRAGQRRKRLTARVPVSDVPLRSYADDTKHPNMADTRNSLTRDEVRDVDRRAIDELGMPGVVLMENAGRESARLFRQAGLDGKVVICCGKGNNGGDGYVIARHLELEGVSVRTLVFAEPDDITGDAGINLRILQQSGANVEFLPTPNSDDLQRRLADADWIVDALLGTGIRGELREPFPTVIAAINAAPARVVAVDLPSGMDCDTGAPLGECVRAEMTATFVARKQGFDAAGADAWTGAVEVVSIGVPRSLLAACGLR